MCTSKIILSELKLKCICKIKSDTSYMPEISGFLEFQSVQSYVDVMYTNTFGKGCTESLFTSDDISLVTLLRTH